MKLLMLFGNDIIDIIKVRKTKLTPSYLQDLKETLIVRNEESLNMASDMPQFALKLAAGKAGLNKDYTIV
jgi:hypothetical protein